MTLREFGQIIPGLQIHGVDAPYPVLNERAVRAAAGIMLLIGAFGFIQALLLGQLLYLQFIVTLFMIDFGIRIGLNPRFSPIYACANVIVSKQKPEWVGAIQKKFAWSIGFVLATSMFVLLNVFGFTGIVTFSVCIICLIALYLETSFGICVGCTMYSQLIAWGILKPEVKAACPGGSCSISVGKHSMNTQNKKHNNS